MNIAHLPTFDSALADSAKLAAVRQIVETAVGFAEHQLDKIREPQAGEDGGTVYAMNAGMLEDTIEVLCFYLGQIAGTVTPDDLLPHLDDLGGAA